MSVVKRQAGPAAQSVLGTVVTFVQRIEALLAAPGSLRASAAQLVQQLTERQVWEDLRFRPVTDLADLGELGLRISTVLDAGFPTVASVLSAQPQQLYAGVGSPAAQQFTKAAAEVAEKVRQETEFEFQPESRDPHQTLLLATLAAIRHVESLLVTLAPTMRLFLTQAGPLVTQAGPLADSSARLRGEDKQAAFAALAQLESIFADPRFFALWQDVARAEELADPGTYGVETLWRDYAETTVFHTLLSGVVGIGGASAKLADALEAAQGRLPETMRQEIDTVPLDTRYLTATLRAYQSFGAKFAINRRGAILGDEMGLGKTVQALAAIGHLAAAGQLRFLVLCPSGVQLHWLREIALHTSLPAHSLQGDRLHDEALVVAAERWLTVGGIAVATLDTVGKLASLADAAIAMLVVDEAHQLGDPESARWRQVAVLAESAQWTLYLSGMPRESGRFAELAEAYLRRSQDDVLTELPGMVEVEDWLRFSAADDVAYTKAVLSGNLMQMRTAAFQVARSAKLDRLREIIAEARENERKVAVFSTFPRVLETVLVKLGGAVIGPLHGAMSPQEMREHTEAFAHRAGHAVLLSQFDAVVAGLDARAASVVIVVEPQWSLGDEQHAIASAHWRGQLRTVQVHRLLVASSVDERMREVQQNRPLLQAEYARSGGYRPTRLDDSSLSVPERIVFAERHRLGIA